MSIYRQHVVLKRHKSNVAFLEAKMLFLYILLLSCCLSGSMGSATAEFQRNFKALRHLAIRKIFVPVPDEKFQCYHVPCQLERTIEELKFHNESAQVRARVSLMEKNMEHIISSLKIATKPKSDRSCPMTEMRLPKAVERYEDFFQKLNENC